MPRLIFIRHGQSVWNQLNLFTGWVDVPLSKKGRKEAIKAGKLLAKEKISLDVAFTSTLMRAHETLNLVLYQLETPYPIFVSDDKELTKWAKHSYKGPYLPIFMHRALNERYYGKLQGLNKAETAKRYGKEQVHLWRRSFAIAPPGGESLKDTIKRVLPYFKRKIMPYLKQGKNVLIVAHGNSLRALTKYLEKISDEDIPSVEIPTGVPIIYDMTKTLIIKKKTILQ